MQRKNFFACLVFFFLVSTTFVSGQTVCGNGVCEPGENSCTCNKDCGSCTASAWETCVSYECTKDNICRRSTVALCCGNNVCESNEDFGNCQRDCEPTKVDIRILQPGDKNFLFGEKVIINALVTSHGLQTTGAVVRAKGFFGELELFNDGKHSDGNGFDSVYGNSFVVSSDVNSGLHTIRATAIYRNVSSFSDAKFDLSGLLDAKLEVFDSYYLGEEIDIRGNVSGKGVPKKMLLDLNIFSSGKQVFSQQVESSIAGNFSLPFHTSLVDPEGAWDINVSGIDEFGNRVLVSKQVTLFRPPKERFLEVELLKGLNASLPAGSLLELFVKVKDRNRVVTGASVALVDEQNTLFAFQELSPGSYSLSFEVPFSLGVGQKNFRVLAEKSFDGSKIAGSKEFSLSIEASTLAVQILRPLEKSIESGKDIEIRAIVSYPDNSPAQSAEVFAVLAEKKLKMYPAREGVFSLVYHVPAEPEGIMSLEVRAADAFGNTGFDAKTVEIVAQPFSAFLEKNLLPIALVIVVFALLVFFAKEKLLSVFKGSSLEKRKKELQKMEKQLQKKYFEEKSISREEYKRLLESYESEIKEIDSKQKEGKK